MKWAKNEKIPYFHPYQEHEGNKGYKREIFNQIEIIASIPLDTQA